MATRMNRVTEQELERAALGCFLQPAGCRVAKICCTAQMLAAISWKDVASSYGRIYSSDIVYCAVPRFVWRSFLERISRKASLRVIRAHSCTLRCLLPFVAVCHAVGQEDTEITVARQPWIVQLKQELCSSGMLESISHHFTLSAVSH